MTTTRTTPASVAAAMRAMAPAARPPAPAFDRTVWEGGILSSRLHRHARLVALALAHLADASGELPKGGQQHAGQLAVICNMDPKSVRISLTQLERQHFLQRPPVHGWTGDDVRPVTLTMPARRRTEPPSPGEPR